MRKLLSILILGTVLFSTSCQNKGSHNNDHDCPTLKSAGATQLEHPDWAKDATIYEVNIRQYTPEGTLAAFEKHLPRLQKLGVEILWLMPIHPISEVKRKGSLGSYYAVADYKDVNPEFGTLDDFKAFMQKAHVMGFKVVLDWVANHTGWDNPWIFEHPEWFTKDSTGQIIPPVADWSDIADLNFDAPEMRAAMIDAMEFWVKETDLDGFRCDVAWGVPKDFWEEARSALNQHKNVWMLAEDEEHKDFLNKSFNCNYSWSLHHKLNEIAQGKEGISAIKEYFAAADTSYPMGSYMMQFTSNHDENSWQGTVYERMGDAVKTMATLTFTMPGMPLIYSGQEAGLNHRLLFFEKDEIDWSNLEMQKLYEKLIDIKQKNKALWNGAAGANIHFLKTETDNSLLAFSREKEENLIVAIFNLSDKPIENKVTCKKANGEFIDLMNGETVALSNQKTLSLNAWSYKILKRK